MFDKVTHNFGIAVLAFLVIALGCAAKHGQFDPPHQQGQFLAKSVKMEHAACMDMFDTFVIPAAGPVLSLEASPIISLPRLARLNPVYSIRFSPLLV